MDVVRQGPAVHVEYWYGRGWRSAPRIGQMFEHKTQGVMVILQVTSDYTDREGNLWGLPRRYGWRYTVTSRTATPDQASRYRLNFAAQRHYFDAWNELNDIRWDFRTRGEQRWAAPDGDSDKRKLVLVHQGEYLYPPNRIDDEEWLFLVQDGLIWYCCKIAWQEANLKLRDRSAWSGWCLPRTPAVIDKLRSLLSVLQQGLLVVGGDSIFANRQLCQVQPRTLERSTQTR